MHRIYKGEADGREVLVQVYDTGAALAYRDNPWDSWGVPIMLPLVETLEGE